MRKMYCILLKLSKEMIAQEVMSFKASKQGLLQPQPSVSLRRKERYTSVDKLLVTVLPIIHTFYVRSLSAQDRETLERSQQVAAQSRTTDGGAQDPHAAAASGSVAASTVANHPVNHMEVDELERELSGHM